MWMMEGRNKKPEKSSFPRIRSKMYSFMILFSFCSFSNICSIPTPTPQPPSFELLHDQAISRLNLTKQEFDQLSSKYSNILSDPVNQFSKHFIHMFC